MDIKKLVCGNLNGSCKLILVSALFEQKRKKILTTAQKYDVDIDECEAAQLAEAFAILEPQIPNIMNIYFSKLQQDQPSDVIVLTLNTN